MRRKRKQAAMILAGMIAWSVCGCAQSGEMASDLPETEEVQTEDVLSGNEGTAGTEEAGTEETTQTQEQEEDALTLADLADVEFYFSSGAGGWATTLTMGADGSFSGEYFDGELGDTGDGYPNGSMYQCSFTGRFSQPVKINAYTYSVRLEALEYAQETGTEEIIDEMRYLYTDAYGLDGAEELLLYLPGAPLAELPEDFLSWVGYYDLSETEDTELPFCGLYNEKEQCGFSSDFYGVD